MSSSPHGSVQPLEPPLDASKLTRPAPQLFIYYVLIALCSLPAVVIVLPLLWQRPAGDGFSVTDIELLTDIRDQTALLIKRFHS